MHGGLKMPEDKVPSDFIKKCSKLHEYVGAKVTQRATTNVMTPDEIAQHYGIPTGTLANMRCKKVGCPFFRVGGRRIFYRVDQFEKWFFSNPVLTKDAIDKGLNR